MRNAVRFQSRKFNTTEVKDYFINDICFGDDLANWLYEEIKKLGFNPARPWQEDWGWQFEANDCLISIGFDGEEWLITIDPILSIFQRLFGKKVDLSILTKSLHRILKAEPEISKIQWFYCNNREPETDFGAEP